MKPALTVVLIASLSLSACGRVADSRVNPFNWFGSSEEVEQEVAEINPLIPQKRQSILSAPEIEYAGTPVAQVRTLRVEKVAGGAVIRVSGVTATQGSFDVRLVPENEEHTPVKGVLTYNLLAIQPPGFRVGSEGSREVSAGVFRTTQELEGVRTIRVISATKTLQSRR